MKNASTALREFVASKPRQAIRVELYTITLLGGVVYRWANADRPTQVPGGYLFAMGPKIDCESLQCTRGFSTDSMSVKIMDDGETMVSGTTLLRFIQANGLAGASIKMEIGLGQNWVDGLIGTYIAFSGRFSEVKDITDTEATVKVTTWLDLLSQYSVNPNTIDSSCRHVLGDAGCTVNLTSYTVAGAVTAGTLTTLAFPTNLTAPAAHNALGYVTFTSGANEGQQRAVATQDGSGNVTLILPLPSVPAVGDTFSIVAGCDLTSPTCLGRFNNLIHFGGFEFVPPPELGY